VGVDSIPPICNINSPKNNGVLKSAAKNTTVSVTASDNVGVVSVRMLINGKDKGPINSGVFILPTNGLKRGKYKLSCQAFDAAGNVGISPVVTIVKN
jgi:hypothetical protein